MENSDNMENLDKDESDVEIYITKLSDKELAELNFKKIIGLEQAQNFQYFDITELQIKVSNSRKQM